MTTLAQILFHPKVWARLQPREVLRMTRRRWLNMLERERVMTELKAHGLAKYAPLIMYNMPRQLEAVICSQG